MQAVEACKPWKGKNPAEKWGPLLVLAAVVVLLGLLAAGVIEPTGDAQKNAMNLFLVVGGGLLTHVVKEYQGNE